MNREQVQTLKALAKARGSLANAYSVEKYVYCTQGCGNPGLELANAFGVPGQFLLVPTEVVT